MNKMQADNIWFSILARPSLDGLRDYYAQSESLLAAASTKDKARIAKRIQRIKAKHQLDAEATYAEWDIQMQSHDSVYKMLFINFQRYSFIVLASLVLEDHLYRFCLALQDKKKYPEPPSIPHGDSITTYKNYITEKIKLTVSPTLWDWTDTLKYVRNCVVHSSGDVSRSKYQNKLIEIAERNIGVHISGRVVRTAMIPLYMRDNMLMIESEYCKLVLSQVAKTIDALCIKAKLPRKILFENRKIILR